MNAPTRTGRLAGRTALITGASRGIGRAIALRLAREGFDIAVHCRSRRDLAAAVVAEVEARRSSFP
mgnify:CR=1 FL=1